MKKLLKIVLGVFVLFILLLVGLYFSRNLIFEAVIEKAGTAAVGAVVEVDGADLNLFAGSASWDRIQVTDKSNTWTNLFETGHCEFDIALKPLIAGKFIVETMEMDGFRTGTKRQTDGKVVQKKKPPKSSKPSWIETMAVKQLEKEKQNIPVLDPDFFEKEVDTDKIIAALELITPGNVENLNIFADERYQFWETRLEKNDYEDRARSIRDQARALKIDKIKNLEDFQKAITEADSILKKAKKLRKDIQAERKHLKADLKKIRSSAESIPDWIKADYETALKKAKLADFSAENISRMLFGDRVTSLLATGLGYIAKTRELAEEPAPVAEEEPKPEKMPELPGFWIKKMNMNAILGDDIKLKGVIQNISTNQKRTGQPIRIDLGGDSKTTGIIMLRGFLDYTGPEKRDELKLTVNRLPLKSIRLGSSPVFPEKIQSASADIAVGFFLTEKRLESIVEFDAKDVVYDYSSVKDPTKKAARIAKQVAEQLNTLCVKSMISAEGDTMDVNLRSNVDKILEAEAKKIISGEIKNAKKRLRRKLEEKLGNYKGDFLKKAGIKEKELEELLAVIDKDSEAQTALIRSKKKKLEKELKKKMEDKAEKLGKDLFKKLKF